MPETSAPSPYGPLPSARQLRWHELESYCFVHYTVNAFTDREWGLGGESPAIFNPSAFDADQIVAAAKEFAKEEAEHVKLLEAWITREDWLARSHAV